MNNVKPQLTYYDISDDVVAFSTTRHGGCSSGAYGEFNINPYCGDSAAAIAANRTALETELGIDSDDKLIMPHQVHTTDSVLIDDSFMRLPLDKRQEALEGKDAITANVGGISIGVSTADCIPVLLYDERHHAISAVHAGWRGTVKRIVELSVQTMYSVYGTQPSDISAVIGPGISLKNFEVGQEVYDAFEAEGFDMAVIAHRYEKWHIDLPLCNRLQLQEAGVPLQNIFDCGICTYDNVDDFFSARRLGQKSGRIFTGIMLKD